MKVEHKEKEYIPGDYDYGDFLHVKSLYTKEKKNSNKNKKEMRLRQKQKEARETNDAIWRAIFTILAIVLVPPFLIGMIWGYAGITISFIILVWAICTLAPIGVGLVALVWAIS